MSPLGGLGNLRRPCEDPGKPPGDPGGPGRPMKPLGSPWVRPLGSPWEVPEAPGRPMRPPGGLGNLGGPCEDPGKPPGDPGGLAGPMKPLGRPWEAHRKSNVDEIDEKRQKPNGGSWEPRKPLEGPLGMDIASMLAQSTKNQRKSNVDENPRKYAMLKKTDKYQRKSNVGENRR